LGQLTSAPILDLLRIVDERVFPQGSSHIESIGASSHSTTEGLYAPAQVAEPGVALGTLAARDSAEKLVARGAHMIEMGGLHSRRIPDGLDPRAVIALANQFIATGQLPNYLRAAEMGRMVIAWSDEVSRGSVGFAARAAARYRRRSLGMRLYGLLARLWRRTPLLVLLTGWLLSGVFAGLLMKMMDWPDYRTALPFKIWAIGFLALVVLQFVISVRGALRPKSGAPSRSRG
jgi:hypothetical protein